MSSKKSLYEKLIEACGAGNSAFVASCIRENSDEGHSVDWASLLHAAYNAGHGSIVNLIRESGRIATYMQLYWACCLGDKDFVRLCIEERKDKGNINWEMLLDIVYAINCTDIAHAMRDRGYNTLQCQLYWACRKGDLDFVSRWMDEFRDNDQLVRWVDLMATACIAGRREIFCFIRDNGRVSLDAQLYFSIRLGDHEFVEQFIVQNRDSGYPVDWMELSKVAHKMGKTSILTLVIESRRVSSLTLLDWLCEVNRRDIEYIYTLLADNIDEGSDEEWEGLLRKAYRNDNNAALNCIRNSRRVPLNRQIFQACYFGDKAFVLQCIDSLRNTDESVDWQLHLSTAYNRNNEAIVHYILKSALLPLDKEIKWACYYNDYDFVSLCIAKDRDRTQSVNWEEHIKAARIMKHYNIVRCIRNSGRVSQNTQLYESCVMGDLDFVSQCIIASGDGEEVIDWERLVKTAHDKKFNEIVRCIINNAQCSIHCKLYGSCLLGDIDFISQYIAKNRDKGQSVDWSALLDIVHSKQKEIAKCIVENGRYRLTQLVESHLGDVKTEFVIQHAPKQDINMVIAAGLTPLHVACYSCIDVNYKRQVSPIDIITRLLERGADANKKGYMGRTPLHLLCHGQNEDIKKLLNKEIDEIHTQENKEQKLHMGGRIGGKDIVRVFELLIQKTDVNSKDDNGQTSLHLLALTDEAVAFRSSIFGNILLKAGANINSRDKEGRTPIAVAAQRGNHQFVSFLCSSENCDLNLPSFLGRSPLFYSAQTSNIETVTLLVKHQARVNQTDDYHVSPLAVASEYDNDQVVQLLLEHQADPNLPDKEGRTSLHKAAKHGSVQSCRKLIMAKVFLNAQDLTGCSPLHLATTQNQLGIMKMLLDAKCDVNAENNLGNIPLHIAVSNNSKDIAELLLDNESEIDHQNNYGQSPITFSASTLDFKMMKFLSSVSANLKVIDNMRRCLIHNIVAAFPTVCLPMEVKFEKCKDIITWLIKQGLSIDAVDLNQQTPLHLAAKDGSLQLVTFLVAKGANVAARDSFGHMPLVNALENVQVFQYLWEKTLQYVTEKDFCKLQCLCYWLSVAEEIVDKIKQFIKVDIDLDNKPQNVKRLKCQYDIRLESWLKRDADNEIPDFLSNWLPSLQTLTYIDHPTINNVMWDLLRDLQDEVEREDPLVAYIITQCGSVEEKTKAFAQNECDCSCVQKNIRFDMFEVPVTPDHPVWTAFVHMVCKDEYCDYLARLLDGQKRLSQGKLCHYFGKAIARVLSKQEFWDKYPQLQRVTPKDISAGDRRICTMHVIWSDNICPLLEISIDLAPVIDLSPWKPSWCNQHPLLDEIQCIALPKWKMTHEVNLDLMEIGVHEWGPLFHKMPEEMREGYRLAKVVRGGAVCPQIPLVPDIVSFDDEEEDTGMLTPEDDPELDDDLCEWSNAGEFMNTYLLKQVIMHEYSSWYNQQKQGLKPSVQSDLFWARRIYERMEEAFRSRELYSWFIPSYNLLNDDKFVQFQDIAVLYARLCRRLLTEDAAAHFRRAYLGMGT